MKEYTNPQPPANLSLTDQPDHAAPAAGSGNWWHRTFTEETNEGWGEEHHAGVLDDAPRIRPRTQLRANVLNLVIACLLINFVVDKIRFREEIIEVIEASDGYTAFFIATSIVLPIFSLFALWRRWRIGYFLACGIAASMLLAVVGNLMLFASRMIERHLEPRLLDYAENYNQLASLPVLAMCAVAGIWLLQRREVFRQFGLERRHVALSFVLGTIVIYAIHLSYLLIV